MKKTHQTLIKIISRSKPSQTTQLIWVILLFLGLPLLVVGTAQVAVCKKGTVLECLIPAKRPKR